MERERRMTAQLQLASEGESNQLSRLFWDLSLLYDVITGQDGWDKVSASDSAWIELRQTIMKAIQAIESGVSDAAALLRKSHSELYELKASWDCRNEEVAGGDFEQAVRGIDRALALIIEGNKSRVVSDIPQNQLVDVENLLSGTTVYAAAGLRL